MTAQPATVIAESYTVHTPAEGDREVWIAPVRPGQMRRRAIVHFPTTDAYANATASVELWRDSIRTGGRTQIPLQAAQFMARCHVEWAYPDDAGSVVVFASN